MGHALAAVGDDLVLGRGLALAQLDEGTGRFAPFVVGPGDDRGGGDRGVAGEHALDLQRGDVLAAGDDHVLGPVGDADIAVGLDHAQIAGVIPAALEGFGGGLRILQIALHDDVAGEHQLAQRLAVVRDFGAGLAVDDRERGLGRVAHALAGVLLHPRFQRQRRPVVVLGAERGRAVGLGQSVDVGQREADGLHALDHGRRRCGPGDQAVHRLLDPRELVRVGVDEHRMHDGRAAVMAHAMARHGVDDGFRGDLAQTDVGAGLGRDGPRKTPAVAVEHRQRPQIHRMGRHIPGHGVGHGVQIGAAVVIDHALGVAGGAGGEVQRDRVPLVLGQLPVEGRIALGDQRLVFDLADPRLVAIVFGIVDVHHHGRRIEPGDRLGHHGRELAVDHHHLRAAEIQHEGERLRIQPHVQRVEHRAGHRGGEMHLVGGGDVGRHDCHHVALADAAPGQRVGQLAAAAIGLAPGPAQRAVHQRDAVGVDAARPGQKARRRQGRVIGGVAGQALERIVGGHGGFGGGGVSS